MTALLPRGVEVTHATSDVPTTTLFAEEAAAITGAAPKRQAEFATVRDCARRALAELGHSAVPILPGPSREPSWPTGVVGSLTHCEGYRAAAVGRARDLATLGIDAEIHESLPDGVTDLITVGDEPEWLAQLAAFDPGIAWDRLLFSAKESIYKAWFPLTGTWLDFTDCELTIHPHDGTFTGRLLVPGPQIANRTIEQFAGRWAIGESHIFTAVWEPREE